ncbi:plastocyanin/azurin family copper-binding protein [Nitrosopumilus sp. S6]
MRGSYFIIIFLGFGVFFSADYAFAESYSININQGASNPNCSNCFDVHNFNINQGDKVKWINQDSTSHTIVGGTTSDGPNGTFDSGIIKPGNSWTLTFTHDGKYPFFCMLHPWLTGTAYAQEAPKNNTQLTLNIYPYTVREGGTVTISGKLTSNGYGVRDATIYLKDFDPVDLVHDSIGTVITDSNGNFKVTWQVRDLDSGDRRFSALFLDLIGGLGTVSAANSFFNLMESTTVEVYAIYNGNSYYQSSKSCYNDCRNNVITITGSSTESKLIGMVLDSVIPGSSDALKIASILDSGEISTSDYTFVESKLRSAFVKEFGIDANTLSMVEMTYLLENPDELSKLKSSQKPSQSIPKPTPTQKYSTFTQWKTQSMTVSSNDDVLLRGTVLGNTQWDGRWEFIKYQPVTIYMNDRELGTTRTNGQGDFEFSVASGSGIYNFALKYAGSNKWFGSTTSGPTIVFQEYTSKHDDQKQREQESAKIHEENVRKLQQAQFEREQKEREQRESDRLAQEILKKEQERQRNERIDKIKQELPELQRNSYEKLNSIRDGLVIAQKSLEQTQSNSDESQEKINKAWNILKQTQSNLIKIEEYLHNGDTQYGKEHYENAKVWYTLNEKDPNISSWNEMGSNLNEISKLIKESKPTSCFLVWCW